MAQLLTLTVGPAEGDLTGTTNVPIQAAVDRVAAAGGGVVEILPGVYQMHDSLHLRGRVTVRGAGAETVLRKPPSTQSALSVDLGYGHFDVSLAEPDKFRVGMGVHIQDDNAGGFYGTVATLTWRESDRFGTSRMMNHDYARSRNAVVRSVFPIVSGYHLAGASLENLVLDGNKGGNHPLNGCRGGCVFLLQAHDVALRGVVARDYNGDGISFQQCLRTVIEDCLLEGNTGCGLHPGSGSVAPVMRRCRCLNNGGDGIFYCLRVSYSLCEECEIAGNGRDGISIGGRDTHQHIRDNAIEGNGRHAVYFRPADLAMGAHLNVLEENTIGANCLKEGSAEILVEGQTVEVHLLGTRFAAVPHPAVRVEEGCHDIVLAGSECPGVLLDSGSAADAASLDWPDETPLVGPENVPPDGAWHLGTW